MKSGGKAMARLLWGSQRSEGHAASSNLEVTSRTIYSCLMWFPQSHTSHVPCTFPFPPHSHELKNTLVRWCNAIIRSWEQKGSEGAFQAVSSCVGDSGIPVHSCLCHFFSHVAIVLFPLACRCLSCASVRMCACVWVKVGMCACVYVCANWFVVIHENSNKDP